MKLTFRLKGGAGSGNFGHAGRPGKVGGSASGSGIGTRKRYNTASGHPPGKYGRTQYDEIWSSHTWSGGVTRTAVYGVRSDTKKVKRIKSFNTWDAAQRFVDSIMDKDAEYELY